MALALPVEVLDRLAIGGLHPAGLGLGVRAALIEEVVDLGIVVRGSPGAGPSLVVARHQPSSRCSLWHLPGGNIRERRVMGSASCVGCRTAEPGRGRGPRALRWRGAR